MLACHRQVLRLGLVGRGERHIAVDLAVAYEDRSGIGAAEPGGRFDCRIQHRLHIGGRAADDVEHVAGRRLVFERFFEIARAGLQFAEQSRILHRNDRLVGKGAHQIDLPLGERLDPLPTEINRAEHGPLAHEGNPKQGAPSGRDTLGRRIVRVGEGVRDMHDPAFESHLPGEQPVATGDNGSLAQGRP